MNIVYTILLFAGLIVLLRVDPQVAFGVSLVQLATTVAEWDRVPNDLKGDLVKLRTKIKALEKAIK